MSRYANASGWRVEVDHPTSGYTHTTTGAEDQSVQPRNPPKVNARPEIRIPVPKNDKWDEILDPDADVDMRAWRDGVRLPIDTLEDVDQRPGYTVLIGSGGRELKQRVEQSFDQKAVHNAVNDLVNNNTAYTRNIDTPSTSTETNTQIASWSSESGFRSRLEPQPLATDPVEVTSSGSTKAQQTAFHFDARDNDAGGATDTNATVQGSSDYVDGFALLIDAASSWDAATESYDNERVELSFTPNHTIPSDDFNIGMRFGTRNDPTIEIRVEGQVVWSNALVDQSLGWIQDMAQGGNDNNQWEGGDFVAGETYDVDIAVVDRPDGNEDFVLDWIVVYDEGGNRFTPNYTFDNTTDSNDELSGPSPFPNKIPISFQLIPTPQAVTGARAELTVGEGSSPSNGFEIRLSNDQGENFSSNTNSDTFETDSLGASWGPGVILEYDLSRFGTQAETPTGKESNDGVNGHEVSAVTLKADLEDMPIVVNRNFDGHLDSIIFDELAEMADALGAVEWDAANSRMSVEWTAPGQRTANESPDPTDYSATKTTRDVYQKAVVYGEPDVEVVGEDFSANHGTAVALAQDRIQPGSELVTDPDTGERFRRQVDYTIDYQSGEITTQSSGGMTNGNVYEIDYRFQAFGEFTKDGVASPDVAPPVELPGLPSNFLCKQAARLIVNEVDTPLHTAEATYPADATGFSVVESLDPPIVPTGGNALHVRQVENTPEATVLALGSRRSFDDVVSDIRQQVSAVSRKA